MKPINGFSKYLIAEDGTVVGPRGHAISPHLNKGMLAVKIHNDAGKRIAVPIHRAVAEAYIGLQRGLRVRHKDGDTLNNRIENLEIYSPTPTVEQKKAAAKARNDKYRANGGERVKALRYAAGKAFKERLANDPSYADKRAEARRKAIENTRRWQAANPEMVKAHARAVRQRRPHLEVAKVQRRNAAKLCRAVAWADKERINRIYHVARRITEITGIPHHVDHVIPLRGEKVSGLHVPENLSVVAYDYNCSKANRYEV
ncbi:MAG: HNH endonuclease [Chloracidobacterium sp.]|nr:HNH endonuclease [Chloracidobacterium sp.]